MRFLLVFYLVLSCKNGVYASDKALGILVQVNKKETLDSQEFKEFIKKNKLTADRYYPLLKIQFFKKDKQKEQTLESLCKRITKTFSGIVSCELNLKIKPESKSSGNNLSVDKPKTCSSNTTIITPFLESLEDEIVKMNKLAVCDLFKKNKIKSEGYAIDPGLTPFWAQEYTGSDLLKEKIYEQDIDISKASELLNVWDTNEGQHGEKAANLILGPFESALLNSKKTLGYLNLEETKDYFSVYEQAYKQCLTNLNCPRFINNSMGWFDSNQIKYSVQKLAREQEVIFVTSAGNNATLVPEAKRESSRLGDSVLVGSHAPNGLTSSFSNFAPEVDITAPSDNYILSYDHSGKPIKFGGTSGATPLVTASLLAFELIAGVKLSTPQFKELLKKTAITHKYDPQRNYTGAGYLNTYKIGAIAFKLLKRCKKFSIKNERDQCMLAELKTKDLYDFSKEVEEEQVLKNIDSVFPKCGESSVSANQVILCQEKERALKELRKASLLDPHNLKYWEKLACIYKEEGFDINADYYSGLASGKRFILINKNEIYFGDAGAIELLSSDESLKQDRQLVLIAAKQVGSALEYAHIDIRKDHEIVLAAAKTDRRVLKYAHESLKKDPNFILSAVKQNGYAFKYAHKDLQEDRKLVLRAVQIDGRALMFAHEDLTKDREIALAAVKESASSLARSSRLTVEGIESRVI